MKGFNYNPNPKGGCRMIILVLINIVIIGFLFVKDPILATAIAIGVIAALTVSGLISLADTTIKRLKKGD